MRFYKEVQYPLCEAFKSNNFKPEKAVIECHYWLFRDYILVGQKADPIKPLWGLIKRVVLKASWPL